MRDIGFPADMEFLLVCSDRFYMDLFLKQGDSLLR